MNVQENTHTPQGAISGITKVERYGWQLKDEPGRLMWIEKGTLFVNQEDYQRAETASRTLTFARNFSWLAFGTLIIAERDGRLYVVDGQHRLAAARKRADVQRVPCIIFYTENVKEEAEAFITANRNRRPMRGSELFKAQLTAGDDTAAFVADLLAAAGRTPSMKNTPTTLAGVLYLTKLATTNRAALSAVWPLLVSISEGKLLRERIIAGLVYLEAHMPEGESLADKRWSQRILAAGLERLEEGITKASAYYARGGARVYAEGIANVLNKGLHNKLSLGQVE